MAKRVYELMYIADPDAEGEKITQMNESVEKLVTTEGGTIVRIDDIGRRRLAYPINKKREGYYILFEIEGSGQEIAEIERRMRVNDIVMRYITVRVDEDRKSADKKRNKRDAKAAKKASFRKTSEQQEEETADDAQ